MKKIIIATLIFIGFISSINAQKTGKIRDSRFNKEYKTVKIGNQWWMAENLNNNRGDDTYGYYYSWYNAKHSCPDGWHLPSVKEYETMVEYLGGKKLAGAKLKSYNFGGSNNSGFNAIGAGSKMNASGNANQIGTNTYFWTSTEYNSSSGYYMNLSKNSKWVSFGGSIKSNYQSVRCIKD